MKNRIIIILALLTCLFTGCNNEKIVENKQESKGSTPIFYKITKPKTNNTIYLLGSIHAADETAYPLNEKIMQSFNDSDYLAVEVNINELNSNLTEQIELAQKMLYIDNTTIKDHLGDGIVDYCLADTGDIVPEYVRIYNKEGSDRVELDTSKSISYGIKLIKRDLSCIKNGAIRHDEDKVASIIMELICNELKFKDMQNDTEYLLIKSVLDEQNKYIEKKSKQAKKQKNMVKKATNKVKRKDRRASKFATKYKERVKSIQNSEAQKEENQRIAKEIEKMQERINKSKREK